MFCNLELSLFLFFSGCHENPELIWNDESREKVSGEVKDMKNRYANLLNSLPTHVIC